MVVVAPAEVKSLFSSYKNKRVHNRGGFIHMILAHIQNGYLKLWRKTESSDGLETQSKR